MPKIKSHKSLLKRIRVTKSGLVKFRAPNSRHLKSNKTGEQVQSYRRPQFARRGVIGRLQLLLQRPLKSQEQHVAELAAKAAREAASAETAGGQQG